MSSPNKEQDQIRKDFIVGAVVQAVRNRHTDLIKALDGDTIGRNLTIIGIDHNRCQGSCRHFNDCPGDPIVSINNKEIHLCGYGSPPEQFIVVKKANLDWD